MNQFMGYLEKFIYGPTKTRIYYISIWPKIENYEYHLGKFCLIEFYENQFKF
jgi:hypothetical protein